MPINMQGWEWVILIVLALLIVGIAFSFFMTPQFRPVQTDVGMQMIEDGRVQQARIVDGEQRVDLTLSKADGDNGTKVQFY